MAISSSTVTPLNVAKYLLFTGRMLAVDEWRALGTVNEIVEPGQLAEHTQELASEIADGSMLLLSRMKRAANEAVDKTLADALRDERFELRGSQGVLRHAERAPQRLSRSGGRGSGCDGIACRPAA